MHADLSQRVAVSTDGLAWLPRDGVDEKLLEATAERRTALVRLPPGSALPLAGAGCVDLIVLDGMLFDAHGYYGPRTYIHDAATVQLTAAGITTVFVKQRPAIAASRWRVDIAQVRPGPADVQGLASEPLYADAYGRVALLRFEPGAALARHKHELGEEFLVLDGQLDDDLGRYATRWWVRQPPGSEHAVRSGAGATTLVFADHLSTRTLGPSPGDLIANGNYRLDAVLSHGHKCTVFAATAIPSGRRCAVKVLTTGWHHAELVQRFMTEARLLSVAASPHVVAVSDLGVLDDGPHYLVMELVDGAPPRGPLAPALVVDIAAQACEGLAALHLRGIVHRDIKPGNLLVGTRPDGGPLVKLVSFGVALQLPARSLPRGGVLVGSPPYMPPEQVVGSRVLDPRADVWAMGVTLYELITGRLPFYGDTMPDLAAAICSSMYAPIASDAPAPLAAVIDRCLAKERDKRFASAAELGAALAACR
jgi:hypothetical protein